LPKLGIKLLKLSYIRILFLVSLLFVTVINPYSVFFNFLNIVVSEMGLKVGCFAGFYHHHVITTTMHTHVYHYPLYESGTKTGL